MARIHSHYPKIVRFCYSLWIACWSIATLPLGAPLLVLIELVLLFISPQKPVHGAFSSAYENLRRVLEPILESFPQTLVQLAYLLLLTVFRGQPFNDYLLLGSLLASITQLYQTYHFISNLAITYRRHELSIVLEVLAISPEDKVPFRLVLRSWPSVNYLGVARNLTKEWIKQVGEALAGNSTLRCLRFAKRQLNQDELELLCAPLTRSQVRQFEVIDDWGQQEHENDAAVCERLLGEQNEYRLPEALIHETLGSATSLRILRLEGYCLEARQ